MRVFSGGSRKADPERHTQLQSADTARARVSGGDGLNGNCAGKMTTCWRGMHKHE